MFRKSVSVLLLVCLAFQQSGYGQSVVPMPSGFNLPSAEVFRPIHLRAIRFSHSGKELILDADPGDMKVGHLTQNNSLIDLFYTGLKLPLGDLWVNLRPDAPEKIISEGLDNTYLGKIFLEADVQLKKDLSALTDPRTPAGRKYWNALYSKAEELFKDSDIEIPTVSRPWIVPGEIFIRQSQDEAYIYKATLRVKLEEDYIIVAQNSGYAPVSAIASRQADDRIKELNTYSSELLKKLVLPQLNRRVNASREYAPLRQAFFSLILAQWVKKNHPALAQRFLGNYTPETAQPWSKQSYYEQYRKSFEQGEYRVEEQVRSPQGITIRTYCSGGIIASGMNAITTDAREDNQQLFDGIVPRGMSSLSIDLFKSGTTLLVPQITASAQDGGTILDKSQQDQITRIFIEKAQLGLIFLNNADDFDSRSEQIQSGLQPTKDGDQSIVSKMNHDRQVVVFVPPDSITDDDLFDAAGDLNDASVDIDLAIGDLFGSEGESKNKKQITSLLALRNPNAGNIAAFMQNAHWDGVLAVSEDAQEMIKDIMPGLVSAQAGLNIFYNPNSSSADLFLKKVEIDGRIFVAVAHSQDRVDKMVSYIQDAPQTVFVPAPAAEENIAQEDARETPAPLLQEDIEPVAAAVAERRTFTQQELIEDILMSLAAGLARTEDQPRARYSGMDVSNEQWEQAWQELRGKQSDLISVRKKTHNKQDILLVQISQEGKKRLLIRQLQQAQNSMLKIFISHGSSIQIPMTEAQWRLYQRIMQMFSPQVDKKFWEEMVMQKDVNFLRTNTMLREGNVLLNEFFDVALVLGDLPIIRFFNDNQAWPEMKEFVKTTIIPEYNKTERMMQQVNGSNAPIAADIFWLMSRRLQGISDKSVLIGYALLHSTHSRPVVFEKVINETVIPFLDVIELSYPTDETRILGSSGRSIRESQLPDILVKQYAPMSAAIKNINSNVMLDAVVEAKQNIDSGMGAMIGDIYSEMLARYILEDLYLMYRFNVQGRQKYVRSVRMRLNSDFNCPNPWRNYLMNQRESDIVYFMTTDIVTLGRYVCIQGQEKMTYSTFLVVTPAKPKNELDSDLSKWTVAMVKDLYDFGADRRGLPEHFQSLDEVAIKMEEDEKIKQSAMDQYLSLAKQPSLTEEIARINYLRLLRKFLEYENLPTDNIFIARFNVPSMPIAAGDQFIAQYGELAESMRQIARILAREKKALESIGLDKEQALAALGVARASKVRTMAQRGIPIAVIMDAIQNQYWNELAAVNEQYDERTVKRFFSRDNDPRKAIEALQGQAQKAEEFVSFIKRLENRISLEPNKELRSQLEEANKLYQELAGRYADDISAVCEIMAMINSAVETLFRDLKERGLSVASKDGAQLIQEMVSSIKQQAYEYYDVADIDFSYERLRIVYSAYKHISRLPMEEQADTARPSRVLDVNAIPGEEEERKGSADKEEYLANNREDKALLESALTNFEDAARKYYDSGKYNDSARMYSKAVDLAGNESEFERALQNAEAELKIRELLISELGTPDANEKAARLRIKRRTERRNECARKVDSIRGMLQKDGGTTGGIDWRMMSANVQAAGSGINAPMDAARLHEIAMAIKITDWAAEWEAITRQCSQAQIDHKKFRDFSAACFAQPEGKEYQQRVIALALQLLKSEESSGIDSPPELKETLLILG